MHGAHHLHNVLCRREWPIQGGECDQLSGDTPSIIISGHEDGKVKLWLSQRNALSLLTCLDTARYFTTDDFRNVVTKLFSLFPFQRKSYQNFDWENTFSFRDHFSQ